MKIVEDYQKLWNLTDKEYIYLLEGFYFHGNDRIKKIINQKGYCAVEFQIILDMPFILRMRKGYQRINGILFWIPVIFFQVAFKLFHQLFFIYSFIIYKF